MGKLPSKAGRRPGASPSGSKGLFAWRPRRGRRYSPCLASAPRSVTPSAELAGKWVAYSEDGARIVAHGETLAEVQAEARRAAPNDRLSFERLDPLPWTVARIEG